MSRDGFMESNAFGQDVPIDPVANAKAAAEQWGKEEAERHAVKYRREQAQEAVVATIVPMLEVLGEGEKIVITAIKPEKPGDPGAPGACFKVERSDVDGKVGVFACRRGS